MKNQIFTFLLVLAIGAVLAICSCNKSNNNGPYQVSDADGNLYDTVHIGKQIWMKENFNAAHFRDGTAITEMEDGATWTSIINTGSKTAAWCNYGDTVSNSITYGKLYNWYAVAATNQLCPYNWHVATDTEWHTLVDTLDALATWAPDESELAGGKLKAITLWTPPSAGATNSNGFTALPGGSRSDNGAYSGKGQGGYFWTSTQGLNTGVAWARSLNADSANIGRGDANKENGFSVRCVHD